MTEKQKSIIMKLAGDPELLKEYLGMVEAMEKKPVGKESTVSLYAMRRHTEDGTEYYHPVVVPKMGTMGENPDDYMMVADKSIITLQNTYERNIAMMRSVTREEPIILTIPETTYVELQEKLLALVTAIYTKIDEAGAILESISELTRMPIPSGMRKGYLMSSIMSKMTVSGACLNENYGIEEAHEYVDETPRDEYDEDGEYDEDEDEYNEDEYDGEDDCECGCCGCCE